MPSQRIRRYLYRLDDIEQTARRNFGHCTGLYIHYITREFMRYWRELQAEQPEQLQGKAWNELQFFFEAKLRDIAWSRFDMEWMIWEFDEDQLHADDYEPGPFWRE